MDPEHLADLLAGRDAHIALDIPLAVVEAMRAIVIERDNLLANVARLTQRATTAELSLLSMSTRVARSLPAFDGVPDEDDQWCGLAVAL